MLLTIKITEFGEGNGNDSALKLRQKLLNQVFAIIQMNILQEI